jgi:hypothetical protein
MGAPKGNQFWKLRAKHGRDKIFSSPEILWESCKEYFEATDKRVWEQTDFRGKDAVEVKIPTQAPYTLTGLYLFLDIDRKTWDLYRERQDFIPIITRVENIIYTQKFEGASVGAFNSSIIARDLGLRDKKELSGENGGPIKLEQITGMEIK